MQKTANKDCTYLIKFFEVILGTLIAAPTKLLPVTNIPLQDLQMVTLDI
jgi:hypothetical protein